MALPVHHGPSSITPPILLSLHRRSTAAQSPDPNSHSGRSGSLNLTTAILFGVVIITLFSLGFFTAYLRRCLRNRATSSEAAVLAAVTAAAIATPPNRRRRGLDSSTIESFPSIPFSSVQCIKPNKLRYGPECAICLSGFSDEEILRLLPGCRHVFHAECIDTWLASHITCPVCRADLSDPIVAAAGQSLMVDLADERCSDAVEIVVEMFHLDPDPDPDPQLHPLRHMAQPENGRRDLDLAKPHRRAASLVSFHGRRSARLESLIRNVSVQRQMQADSDLGQRSSMQILQGTPRHSDPGQRPGKLFLPGLHRHESSGSRAGNTSRWSGREVGPTGSQKGKNYAHYVSFTGFVINGDVAANDWLPEIFQVSTAMQSTPSN